MKLPKSFNAKAGVNGRQPETAAKSIKKDDPQIYQADDNRQGRYHQGHDVRYTHKTNPLISKNVGINMSELVSYAALGISVFSLMMTIYDRRLRKTPPIGYQSEYTAQGETVRISMRLGRLPLEPYLLEGVRTIGNPRPKIISVQVFRVGDKKPVLVQTPLGADHNLTMEIDSAFDHPNGDKTACLLVCEVEKPKGKSASLQIRYRSSYWPRLAWYNTLIPLTDTTAI